MARWRRWISRLVNFLRPDEAESHMQREMDSHLRLSQDEFIRQGISENDALWAAKRAYGPAEQVKELHRDERSFLWLEQLRQDLRHALRQFRVQSAFTVVTILSLAFGIGANTGMFSVMNVLLMKSLPVPKADQLVQLDSVNRKNEQTLRGFSYPGFRIMKAASGRVLSGVFAYSSTDTSSSIYSSLAKSNVIYKGNAEIAKGMLASGEMYSVLGVQPFLGRLFVAGDDRVKAGSPVVVLAYGYWRARFGGDRGVIGKTLVVNRVPLTVIGVTPKQFRGVELDYSPDFTVPVSMADALKLESLDNRNAWWLSVLGRKKPDLTNGQVEAALQPAFRESVEDLIEATPADLTREIRGLTDGLVFKISPASQGAVSAVRDELGRSFALLMTTVALLLGIACVNVANLLLARTAAREREIRLRMSVGASRFRVSRQLMTEMLALAFTGGLLALPCAWFGAPLLLRMFAADSTIASLDAGPDWRVFLFAFAIALMCGICLGLVPLIQIREKRSSRSKIGGIPDGLMVAQIALALMLAAGAGLLVRSFQKIRHVDPGFRPDGVLAFGVTRSSLGYTGQRERGFYTQMKDELASLPGVISVSFARSEPGSSDLGTFVRIAGEPPSRQNEPISANVVDAGYFRTVGIDLLAGRDFDAHDVTGAQRVVIVNESFARRYFGHRFPLGLAFNIMGDENAMHIVGVVKDAKEHGLLQPAPMMIYLPYQQGPGAYGDQLTFFIRSAGDPLATLPAVRATLRRLNPLLPLSDVRTLRLALQSSVRREQVLAQISTLMGLTALALASLGVYGVIAYRVSCETKAVGIRMALGAKRSSILWLVMHRVMVLLTVGVGLGLIAVFSCAHLVSGILFGVSPNDPVSMLTASAALIFVALASAYFPARRAAGVDPAITLRHE